MSVFFLSFCKLTSTSLQHGRSPRILQQNSAYSCRRFFSNTIPNNSNTGGSSKVRSPPSSSGFALRERASGGGAASRPFGQQNRSFEPCTGIRVDEGWSEPTGPLARRRAERKKENRQPKGAKERKQTTQGRDGRTARRHDTGILRRGV